MPSASFQRNTVRVSRRTPCVITDSSMVSVLFLVVVVVVALVIRTLRKAGLFSAFGLRVQERELEPFSGVGKPVVGPYKDVGKTMSVVEGLFQPGDDLIALKDVTCGRFGLYYDNPQVVAGKDCRSFVGVLLKKPEYSKYWKSNEVKLREFPRTRVAVVRYPAPFSIVALLLSLKLVYPKLMKYLKDKKAEGPCIVEQYLADSMFFFSPLDNKAAFELDV